MLKKLKHFGITTVLQMLHKVIDQCLKFGSAYKYIYKKIYIPKKMNKKPIALNTPIPPLLKKNEEIECRNKPIAEFSFLTISFL